MIDEALVAALTGDRREEYIEALLERAEVMTEFHVDLRSVVLTRRQAAGAAGALAGGDPRRDRRVAQAVEFAIETEGTEEKQGATHQSTKAPQIRTVTDHRSGQ
ncbi:hypothetical protein [Rhodococcus koreensis]|uniref:hypothetical protein n=1 Tax=Rhodococcus koreensis TaxID=99653 RepID=UPI003671738C